MYFAIKEPWILRLIEYIGNHVCLIVCFGLMGVVEHDLFLWNVIANDNFCGMHLSSVVQSYIL